MLLLARNTANTSHLFALIFIQVNTGTFQTVFALRFGFLARLQVHVDLRQWKCFLVNGS